MNRMQKTEIPGEEQRIMEEDCMTYRRDGDIFAGKKILLREQLVEIRLNGCPVAHLSCTCEYLEELVLGHLLTEGFIRNRREIQSLSVNAEKKLADVLLKKDLACVSEERRSAADRTDLSETAAGKDSGEKAVHTLQAKSLFHIADLFAEGFPLYEKTQAIHSCMVCRGDRMLFFCEDLGRHCAFDKAVGFMLKQEIPPSACILYTSGRMPVDMVKKAIRAEIPVVMSKTVPTDDAVKLARENGLILIGAARRDAFTVFSRGSGLNILE